MKKEDAEKLLPLVNNKAALDALLHYMIVRTEAHKNSLTVASSFDQVVNYQGAIQELMRIKNLKDEVLNPRD